MHFSIMNNQRHYIIVLILFFLTGCSKLTNFEKIDNLLKTEFNFNHLAEYDQIVVINELGECLNCNNTFTDVMSRYIDRDNLLFLVCTSGTRIDISPFLKEEKENIILDYRNKFESLDLINHCAIFELEEERVDSIIEVSSENVREVVMSYNK